MKVQISIDDKLVERVDKYAEENYISRSGLFSIAMTQYLNANETLSIVRDMGLCMRKIADNNCVDAETMEKLKDFERLSQIFTQTR